VTRASAAKTDSIFIRSFGDTEHPTGINYKNESNT